MWPHIARWLVEPAALGILVTPLAANTQLDGESPADRDSGQRVWGTDLGGVPRQVLRRPRAMWKGRLTFLEPRFIEGKYDQLPHVLAELIGLKVDVIVTGFARRHPGSP